MEMELDMLNVQTHTTVRINLEQDRYTISIGNRVQGRVEHKLREFLEGPCT